MNTCTNCGKEFTDKYCNHCGVKKNDGRLYLKDQLHDALYYVFSVDSPITATFIGLMTNPGKVGHEYIEGKRKKYYTPIKYFILCTAIYFLLVKITGINPVSVGNSEIIVKNYNYLIFLLVPILAVFSKLFFYKQKFNYAEYIAYSFFLVGHYMILNILYIPFIYFFPEVNIGNQIFAVYLIWGMFSFHKGNPIVKLLLSFLSVVLSFIVFLGLTLLIFVSFYKIFG